MADRAEPIPLFEPGQPLAIVGLAAAFGRRSGLPLLWQDVLAKRPLDIRPASGGLAQLLEEAFVTIPATAKPAVVLCGPSAGAPQPERAPDLDPVVAGAVGRHARVWRQGGSAGGVLPALRWGCRQLAEGDVTHLVVGTDMLNAGLVVVFRPLAAERDSDEPIWAVADATGGVSDAHLIAGTSAALVSLASSVGCPGAYGGPACWAPDDFVQVPGVNALVTLAITAVALRERTLPPVIRESVAPTGAWAPDRPIPWVHGMDRGPRRALVVVPAAGVLHGIRLRAAADAPQPRSPTPWPVELVLLAANSHEALAERVAALRSRLEDDGPTSLTELAREAAAVANGPHRLALPAATLAELDSGLRDAERALTTGKITRAAWRTGLRLTDPETMGGKLAVLFPGLGSSYPGMLAEQIRFFPVVGDIFDAFDDAWHDRPDGQLCRLLYSASAPLPDPAAGDLWTNMEGAGCSGVVASVALDALLKSAGVAPDLFVGFSNGENTALLASGVLRVDPMREFLPLAVEIARRGAGGDRRGKIPKGRTLGVTIDNRDELDRMLAEYAGRAYVALDSSPHHVVLFADSGAMDEIVVRLRSIGAICLPLPFYRAYHTPLLEEEVRTGLRTLYDAIPMHPPCIPLWSCVTNAPFPEEPEAIRQLASRLWTSPVRFREAVETLHAEQVRVFLEVGPRDMLAGYVADTLRGKSHVTASMDRKGASGHRQILIALGTLFVHGVDIDLDALRRDRTPTVGAGIQPPTEPQTSTVEALPSAAVRDRTESPGEKLETVTGVRASPMARERIFADYFALMNGFLDSQARAFASVVATARKCPPSDPALMLGEVRPLKQLERPSDRPWPMISAAVEEIDRGVRVRERLDPAVDLHLDDHRFGRRPAGESRLERPLPILALAMGLEAMAEAAMVLAERQGVGEDSVVREVRHLKAQRWVALDRGYLDVVLEARWEGDLRDGARQVHVRLLEAGTDGALNEIPSMEAQVVLGPPLVSEPPRLGRLGRALHPRWSAVDFNRLCLFHGPSFTCMIDVEAISDAAIIVAVETPPKDGLFAGETAPMLATPANLLDVVGQAIALWLVEANEWMFGSFPTGAARYCQFPPFPNPGDRVTCQVTAARNGSRICATAELVTADGRLIARFEDLLVEMFRYPEPFLTRLYWPELAPTLSVPLETGDPRVLARQWTAISAADLNRAGRIFERALAHVTLTVAERSLWYALPERGPRRRTWLLGRITAKDVIRHWASERFGVTLDPLDIEVLADHRGRPVVRLLTADDTPSVVPNVSISHSGEIVVAAVSSEPQHRLGIDVEALDEPEPAGLALGFTPEELAALPPGVSRRLWWSVKEAAAKAVGTGLLGVPRGWHVSAGSSNARATVTFSGRSLPVLYRVHEGFALAICVVGHELQEANDRTDFCFIETTAARSGTLDAWRDFNEFGQD